MGLTDSFLLDPPSFDLVIAARRDNACGVGAADDPFNGATQRGAPVPVSLENGLPPENDAQHAQATAGTAHGLVDGDVVEISGVTGDNPEIWNGTFGIYGVTQNSFKYYMKRQVFTPALGNPYRGQARMALR